MKIEKKFEWCLKKGEAGRKHRGLREIGPDLEKSEKHVEKALHNLKAMEHNLAGGFTDWAASAAFYAMYHILLAILFRLGYDSRNQECTFNTIEYFIGKGKLNITQDDINKIRDIRALEKEEPHDAKTAREDMQYGTEIDLEERRLEKLKSDAKEIVNKFRAILEEL